MIDIISNNPFRVLGVYTNAKPADILRNVHKMAAYLKVGKPVEQAIDINYLLPSLIRSVDKINQSQSQINLPNDKVRYALFWFSAGTPVDQVALNNLASGDITKALEIFNKRDNFSSLVNKAVIALIQGRIADAVGFYSTLTHTPEHRQQFVQSVCDDTIQISETDFSHLVLDELSTIESAQRLISCMTNKDDIAYLSEKSLEIPKRKINEEIAKAKSVSSSEPAASLQAGKRLIQIAKSELKSINDLIGNSVEYESIADGLAKQILQCGINYYNETSDNDSIDKALEVQQYALSIAVGRMVKKRCEENVNILLEKKRLQACEGDVKILLTKLSEFQRQNSSTSNAKFFVCACKPYLSKIASALGKSNESYLKLSSLVANQALGMLIEIVNNLSSSSGYTHLTQVISNAKEVMDLIDKELDMNSEERSHFDSNYKVLKDLYLKVRTSEPPTPPQTSSSGGCYIATMVYGDYDDPQVMVLREFRDNVLQKSLLGRLFVKFYYKYSPTWVEHLKDKKKINNVIRHILDKFIDFYKNEKN